MEKIYFVGAIRDGAKVKRGVTIQYIDVTDSFEDMLQQEFVAGSPNRLARVLSEAYNWHGKLYQGFSIEDAVNDYLENHTIRLV